MALLIAMPVMAGDRRLPGEERLPKYGPKLGLGSASPDPGLKLSITAGAEECERLYRGEVRMMGGDAGVATATVCFGPEKPTGDVELVSGLGDSLSMHYLVFTYEPKTSKAGYSLKRVLGGGSFTSQAFLANVSIRQ